MTTTHVCSAHGRVPWSKYGNVKFVVVSLGNNSVVLLLVAVNLVLVLDHTRSSVVMTQLHIFSFIFSCSSGLGS